jgi:type VI protein secretion system component Hcp
MLDLFLQIDGVQGESKDTHFAQAASRPIEITKFSLGGTFVGEISNEQKREKAKKKGELAGRGSTLDKFSFSITKPADTASVDLLLNYAQTLSKTLTPYPWARILVRKPGSANFFYLMLEFTEVFVTGYEMDFDDADTNTPIEDIDFCFSSCVMSYTPQTRTGAPGQAIAPMGWNFKTNTQVSS